MFKNAVLTAVAVAGFSTVSYAGAVVTGDIAVYRTSSDTLIGYVSDVYDGQNSFTYTANISNALSVAINPSTSVFEIMASNPPDPSHPYFGAVGGSGGYDLTASGAGYAYLAGTSPIAQGAPASAGNSLQSLGYNAPAEATMWSHIGNVLTAEWINSDATTDAAAVFYDPVVDYLAITGDLAAYNSAYGDGAYAVTLEFTGTFPSTAVPEPSSLAIFGAVVVGGIVRRRRKSTEVSRSIA